MNLRNFFLLVFFDFFLTFFNFKNFNHAYAIDTFSSSTPLKNIINKNDATDFKDIKFIKNEKKKLEMVDYMALIYIPRKNLYKLFPFLKQDFIPVATFIYG